MTPIFKKGDRSKAANYRPVSLTCISCKLMEHVISSNLMKHLEEHSILTDAQHGFRKRRSCESQLLSTVHDLAMGIENRKQLDVILLDFSKAFNKVPHRRLLLKLHHYGIRGTTQQWIAHFLQGRDQKVILNGQSSNSAPVHSGVPQGMVLGPILFLVYINDLPNCVQSPCRLFADDCIIYRNIDNEADANTLQQDLDNLQKWEQTWLMAFHPEKCVTMRVTNKRNTLDYTYKIRGHPLKLEDSTKYLGVNLHPKLSWSPHITATAHKADHTRAFLQRNMRSCPRNVRAKCYTTLVRPILEYSSPVWDPHLQKDTDCLEKVQRRCARFAFQEFSRESSMSSMMHTLQWESLAERRAKAKVTMLYRIANNLVALPLNQYLKPSATNTRGHDYRLFIPYCRTNTLRHSFFPDAARLWNKLPTVSTVAPSLEAFRASLQGRKLL